MSDKSDEVNLLTEMKGFFETFDYEEVLFVIKKFKQYRKYFNDKKEEEIKKNTKYISIIDIADPEFPDMYRLTMEDKKPSRQNEIMQNGKYYNVITTLKVPIDLQYKKIVRSLTKKLPEKGRMKYNWTFHKDKLNEVVEALRKKNENE